MDRLRLGSPVLAEGSRGMPDGGGTLGAGPPVTATRLRVALPEAG